MLRKFALPFLSLTSFLSAEMLDSEALISEENFAFLDTNQASVQDCGDSPRPMRISMRHIEANGIGYNEGYTTLEGFFSPNNAWKEAWIPFLDVRGHIFNNGKPAANAGLGFRYLGPSRVWGFNAFYDYRKTKHQHYNQIAIGLESLGRIWDARLNGYLPVGDKTSSLYGPIKFSKFSGNNAYFSRRYEFAMKGANAEAGFHLDKYKHYPLYFAAGPYYFEGKGKVAWGGQLRGSITIFDYLKLEGNTSYDNVFKWIGQGQVSLVIPFGGKRKIQRRNDNSCSHERALAARAIQNVDRFEIIPVKTKHKNKIAIDPATGQPYFFLFVDNTSHSQGTFESPFNTLAAAQAASKPGDIIYIFPGDGTATGMNDGIILQNRQQLLGSAAIHNLVIPQGSLAIPAMTNSMPIIGNLNNIGSPIITIQNGNVISGLAIDHGANNGNAISQPDSTISVSGLTITNNVVLGNTSSEAFILNNIAGQMVISGNVIGGTPKVAIFMISNNIQNATYSIFDNTIGSQNAPFVFSYSDCTGIVTNVLDNDILKGFSGVSTLISNSVLGTQNSFNFISNSYANDSGFFFLLSGSSNTAINFNSNIINVPSQSGINIGLNDTGICNLFVRDNVINANAGSIILSTNNNSKMTSIISNNTLTSRLNSTIFCANTDSAIMTNSIANNTMYSNFQKNIEFTGASSSSSVVNIQSNSMINSANGVSLTLSDSAALASSIESNTFEGMQNNGLLATLNSSNSTKMVLLNNTFTGNSVSSSTITVNSGQLCLRFLNNFSTPTQYANGLNPYLFTQTGGIFNLEPMIGNVGYVTTSGSITPVTRCD